MGRRGDRQTGFSTLEVLIVVAVVAVIGLVGTFVYFRHYSKVSNVAATNSSQSSSNSNQKTTNTQTQQTATNYITITQWGVRAPYSGNLTLTYTISSDGKSAWFSSNQLTAADSNCVGRGGAIYRYAPTDYPSPAPQSQDAQQQAAANPSLYGHVGNYYYLFRNDQAACDDPTVTGTLQAQTNNAVKALVQNLQAIPTSN